MSYSSPSNRARKDLFDIQKNAKNNPNPPVSHNTQALCIVGLAIVDTLSDIGASFIRAEKTLLEIAGDIRLSKKKN